MISICLWRGARRRTNEESASYFSRFIKRNSGQTITEIPDLTDAPVFAVLSKGDIALEKVRICYALFSGSVADTISASDLIHSD